jgi:hypothetical protein
MRALVLSALVALGGGCGDNVKVVPGDGAPSPDASTADAQVDAGVDASPAVGPCLDRPPGDLPRPPAGQLPCELLPPGFGT